MRLYGCLLISRNIPEGMKVNGFFFMQMIDTITWMHWTAFTMAVVFFLVLDLGVFQWKAHAVSFKETLIWTSLWFSVRRPPYTDIHM